MPGYSKHEQLSRNNPLHRNPEALRAYLGLRMPESEEEAEAERLGFCAFPRCPFRGEEMLQRHHVDPRSQNRRRVDDFRNWLYLCGPYGFGHHQGLHGEASRGLRHWIKIGVRPDKSPSPDCDNRG